MTFAPEQVAALKAPLHLAHVKSRAQAGRNLSYIEAWHAISEANRIFGFDGWARETVELIPLGEPRMVGDKYRVAYRAKVRISVFAGVGDFGDGAVIREGCGFGSGIDKDPDQAHESALKEAESDAMKRALMTFGNPFGLALYDKAQTNVTNARPPADEPAPPPYNPDNPPEGGSTFTGRKSSRQAKADKDDEKIKADIATLDHDGLKDWRLNFDNYTAHLPASWLDSIQNMLELRLEELTGAANVAEAEAELDEGFRGTMGGGSAASVSGRGSQVAA